MRTAIDVNKLVRANLRSARSRWPHAMTLNSVQFLRTTTRLFRFSVSNGDLLLLDQGWYVTHSGLLGLARRSGCRGIRAEPVEQLCDSAVRRFAFKATVYKSQTCKGFVGYGDADRRMSPLWSMAPRCGLLKPERSTARSARPTASASARSRKSAPLSSHDIASRVEEAAAQSANGNGYGGPKVRDRLCQIIRQHQLDPKLVKAYAIDFCGVKTLREATREQVENFVEHLADWAEKDRNALLCQLNSYLARKEKEGAA